MTYLSEPDERETGNESCIKGVNGLTYLEHVEWIENFLNKKSVVGLDGDVHAVVPKQQQSVVPLVKRRP